MMKNSFTNKPHGARKIMDEFLQSSGIAGIDGNPHRRYLYTDAFAVQSCFALSHIFNSPEYGQHALDLIDRVQAFLGRFRPDDRREGWISGLSHDQGNLHPTARGLRIRKNLPEGEPGEPFDSRLEWERDGQYFHYLTRWFHALLQAYCETGENRYAIHAAELLSAAGHFIVRDDGILRMVWKMNTDLTHTRVDSMGAHDPLEGLVCVISAMEAFPESRPALESLEDDLKTLCRGMDWFSTDTLGIGGLLLNTARTAVMRHNGDELPASIRPGYLFADAMGGLQMYRRHLYDPQQPAGSRLAFRECGMTLGIRVLYGMRHHYKNPDIDFASLGQFIPLADEIEDFWLTTDSRQTTGWTDHYDINSVTLAASILAASHPYAFCAGAPAKSKYAGQMARG